MDRMFLGSAMGVKLRTPGTKGDERLILLSGGIKKKSGGKSFYWAGQEERQMMGRKDASKMSAERCTFRRTNACSVTQREANASYVSVNVLYRSLGTVSVFLHPVCSLAHLHSLLMGELLGPSRRSGLPVYKENWTHIFPFFLTPLSCLLAQPRFHLKHIPPCGKWSAPSACPGGMLGS